MRIRVQFLVDALQLSRQCPSDICVFGIKCLFEGVLGLSQGFGLPLVCFDVGSEVV